MVCKIIFRSEFPDIPEKSGRGKKTKAKQLQTAMFYKQTQQEVGDNLGREINITN